MSSIEDGLLGRLSSDTKVPRHATHTIIRGTQSRGLHIYLGHIFPLGDLASTRLHKCPRRGYACTPIDEQRCLATAHMGRYISISQERAASVTSSHSVLQALRPQPTCAQQQSLLFVETPFRDQPAGSSLLHISGACILTGETSASSSGSPPRTNARTNPIAGQSEIYRESRRLPLVYTRALAEHV